MLYPYFERLYGKKKRNEVHLIFTSSDISSLTACPYSSLLSCLIMRAKASMEVPFSTPTAFLDQHMTLPCRPKTCQTCRMTGPYLWSISFPNCSHHIVPCCSQASSDLPVF
jgi:hypothetical protein